MKNYRITLALIFVLFSTPYIDAQTVANVQALAFGNFAAGQGGSVIFSAATGLRTKTGDVTLISSAVGTLAQFMVTGLPNQSYSITLPSDGETFLTSIGSRMAINSFTSKPSPSGALSLGGTQSVAVGATLNVAPYQPPGNYSGTFTVTVNYN